MRVQLDLFAWADSRPAKPECHIVDARKLFRQRRDFVVRMICRGIDMTKPKSGEVIDLERRRLLKAGRKSKALGQNAKFGGQI